MTMKERKLDQTGTGTRKGGAFATPAEGVPPGTVKGARDKPDVVDTDAEEAYWRQNFWHRPYVRKGTSFNEFRPAYRYGADAHRLHPSESFEQVEAEMRSGWDRYKGTSSLTWDDARLAAREAWQRVSDML
jgi:hypothetical protein